MGKERVLIPQPGEVFRDIAETNGKYTVSNYGRVWNAVGCFEVTQCVKDRKIVGDNGYRVVHLTFDGKHVTRPVHRLVALAFVNNPHPNTWNTVNHIDEDKTNNRSDNLEWCDMSYQNSHATHNKRVIETNTRVFRYIPMIVMPDGIPCKSKASAKKVIDDIGDGRYMVYDAVKLGVREHDMYTIEITNNSVTHLFTATNVQMALEGFFDAVMSMRAEFIRNAYKYTERQDGDGILNYKAVVIGKPLQYSVTLR